MSLHTSLTPFDRRAELIPYRQVWMYVYLTYSSREMTQKKLEQC